MATMTDPDPLVLCIENINGEEVTVNIEPRDTFHVFLDKAKALLGYDVDINSIINNQRVSLDSNIYDFLLKAEQHFEGSVLNSQNFDEMIDQNETDDLEYVLDDGTQICASQIQFDNDDPLVDLTAEEIPFVKYKDESPDKKEIDDRDNSEVTIRNVNITDSPVIRWSDKNSPECDFGNSLPFNLVCDNTSNFEAQFAKYFESNQTTYANLNDLLSRNKSPRSIIRDDYKNYDETHNGNDGIYTREDILNLFKDTPVPLPYDDNQTDKRRHVRKTDPSGIAHSNCNTKPIIEVECGLEKHNCFICCKTVHNYEKLYLFDKEDQMLHRCEPKKYNSELKIICDGCLTENFMPSRTKSPNRSLNNDEYLVIKNNQQFIFQKTSNVNLKSSYFINNINVNNNNADRMDIINEPIKNKESVELVKLEIGPDGEIVTKPIGDDVKSDVMIVTEKKESSSDVEIVKPDGMDESEPEIDVDDLDNVDEEVKEFLGKYHRGVEHIELKCRFCQKEFEDMSQVLEHCEEHRHDLDEGMVFPCPLCDYGYANSKWLKGHLKAAHDINKEGETVKEESEIVKEEGETVNGNEIENDDKENNDEAKDNSPVCSPVAKRTRSALKKNNIENANIGKLHKQDTKETNSNDMQEQEKIKTEVEQVKVKTEVEQEKEKTEVKQECQDSSDDESIWIVQTGDDDEQLKKLLQISESKQEVYDLKRHKCFACSKIFPTAASLKTHKCRKRGKKRQFNLPKDETMTFATQTDNVKKSCKGKNCELGDHVVTCHNCNESFTSKVRLKFHMQFHEPTNLLTPDGQYACAECDGAKFPSEAELFDHVHFQHDKQRRWQCPVENCGKTFFLRATLTKHSRTHTDTRRYVCVTCGKRFLDKQTLDEHGVTHLQIKPFQCHICLKQLTRRSRLRMHLRAHDEELSAAFVLVCAVCSRAFRDSGDAQEHAIKSSECIDGFTRELKEEDETEQLSPTSGIVRHAVRVAEFPRLKTSIPKEVNDQESEKLLSALNDAARNIIRVVHIEKAFRCEYCEDVFYMESALNNHRNLHKGVKNPFTCHICKVSFATYSRCTTHKTTHGFYKRSPAEGSAGGGAGPATAGILGYGGFPVVKHFLCEDCGRSYLHWTYFQVHRRVKHANQSYVFKCNQCEVTFPNSWSATYHRKKMHSKNGQDQNGGFTKIALENYRIPCRDCDEVLPNKIALYKHRQKEHCDATLMDKEEDWSDQEDPETTICNKCGHHSDDLIALQKHVKEAHGWSAGEPVARAHTCPVCARTFRSASVCREHVRVHTGERPFPCDVCGVAFKRLTAMRNHRLIHTGARPWVCSRCPKRFRVKCDLRTHLRLKHPTRLAVIEIEGASCSPEEALQHLHCNNISRDKVIEITMMSFPEGSTNIVPSSMLALSMLSDVPRTTIECDWHAPATSLQQSDVLFYRRGRGIDKNPRKPTLLQRNDETTLNSQDLRTITTLQNFGGETPRRPAILQRNDETSRNTQDTCNIMPLQNVSGENDMSTLNVQLLLQDGAQLVDGNKTVQMQLDDGILLE